jgi:drug/metabolite transporter (DMT)-like permease
LKLIASILRSPAVLAALGAALLFGASTPFAKQLAGGISPVLLAGLLYMGSGLGVTVLRLMRDTGWRNPGLQALEWPWLLGAIGFGGVLGPILLVWGLTQTSAGTASLLLNLEAVLTAVLAWLAFKENVDRRIVLGMVLIVAGGVALSWPSGDAADGRWFGPLMIAGACLCWAIDNNLTRKVSTFDALFIAGAKGLTAGIINTALALAAGVAMPPSSTAMQAMIVGSLGYGASLVLYVLALRGLGTARTAAYFSTAPFIGAAIAIAFWQEPTTPPFWVAAILMGLGVWLHLTERHEHQHTHDDIVHSHWHVHDPHHQHKHEFEWDGKEPHLHPHAHLALTHSHPHFPDIHHRHSH